ncbi:hypothetical protein NIES3806_38040 [Microcystis aeruginosa NIES-3806]|nr:hypothetical protein NIES3806_38040 [Microcystis aeruginosa NIES-3806]
MLRKALQQIKFFMGNLDGQTLSPSQNKIIFIAYLIPVALVIWFISKFSVDVPFNDQWALVSLFDKIDKGSATFGDFFALYNGHRILFTQAIFALLAFTSKWNLDLERYFNVFLVIITFFLMYKIAEISDNQDKLSFHLFNISTCFLLFSLYQGGAFVYGYQSVFITNTCLVLAVFIISFPQNIAPNIRLFLAAICCFIASFSGGEGLINWLAVLPSVIAVEGNTKKRILRTVVYMLLFVLCYFIYTIDSQKTSTTDILFFIKNLPTTLNYFFTILGAGFSFRLIPNLTGLLLFLIFLFFNFYSLRKSRSELFRYAAPWLSMGWFTILFALLVTLARSNLGVEQALASRYAVRSIFLTISCLQTGRILMCYQSSHLEQKYYRKLRFYTLTSIVLLILFYNSVNLAVIVYARAWVEKVSPGKNCLEIIHYLNESFYRTEESTVSESHKKCTRYMDCPINNCLETLMPNATPSALVGIRNGAFILERIGFRDFPKQIQFTEPTKIYGQIEQPMTTDKPITLSRSSKIKVTGWATLPERSQTPELVLLSSDGDRSFFANATIVNKSDNKVQWEAEISPQSLNREETAIKGWVYDREGKQFVKLNGEIKLRISKK